MSDKFIRRGIIVSAIVVLLAACFIIPSIRGALEQIFYGREIRYFNNELQRDSIATNNFNFGYDRYAAAEADVKAGKVANIADWVAKSDGTGDLFYSITVDPALCAAIAVHMDETLRLPEKILKDEQGILIGQRADQAHLHFLRDNAYWDSTIALIKQYLTKGSIEVKYVKESPTSQMYMYYNGLEGNKPAVVVRSTDGSPCWVIEFNLGKPGTIRLRLACGYQPIDVGYWPVPPGPGPGPGPGPEPTPTLEPKQPDAGPQGQTHGHDQPGTEDFGGGQNHDPDTTLSEEPQAPETYNPPAAPKNPPKKTKPTPTPKPTEVPGDGKDHGDLATIQEKEHGQDTVETAVAGDKNEGDLGEDAVE